VDDPELARQGPQSLLVPTPPTSPPQLAGRVFRGSSVVAKGLLTKKQLRSSIWRRLRQDVYADAALVVTHRLLVSAVGLTLPERAGFTGLSAATLWGVPDVAGPADPVDVLVPAGTRWNPGPGVRVRSVSRGQELVRRGRWLCATRVDTAVDLIRWGGTEDAVVLLDRLCLNGMVRLDDVRAAVQDLPRCQGSAQARRVAQLADGTAESPQESRLRLLFGRVGLPAPVAQFRVFDDEGLVGRVDFAYPDLKIAIEYDGLWHAEPGQFAKDRKRLNRLVAAGWTVLDVTAADMRHPERLAARASAARTAPRDDEHTLRALSASSRGPSACVRAGERVRQPKSWVHQGPPAPSATPTPRRVRPQFRMFARWPELFIHASMTAAGSGCP
jgi:G:T-mismatch repair DNA endonuclease (very short patch repair protein)